MLEAVIFVGVQASGKSTFYKARFFKTHVRLNLDMLRTRHREKLLLRACLDAGQPFVVDNTNVTQADRARYILPAKAAGFKVTGYYFRSNLQDCLKHNEQRNGKERIPPQGVFAAYKRLQLPSLAEGFDALFYVSIGSNGDFEVQEWMDSHEV
jgi:predicted kinase